MRLAVLFGEADEGFGPPGNSDERGREEAVAPLVVVAAAFAAPNVASAASPPFPRRLDRGASGDGAPRSISKLSDSASSSLSLSRSFIPAAFAAATHRATSASLK